MPFRMFPVSKGSGYPGAIEDVDVDPVDGSIYACGFVEDITAFNSTFELASSNNYPRGFAMKLNRMGELQWFRSLNKNGGESQFHCKYPNDHGIFCASS